jgi:hypothetical protein
MIIALALFTIGICAGLMYDIVSRAILLILSALVVFLAWLVFTEVDIFSFFVLGGNLISLVAGYVVGLYVQHDGID